MKEKGKKWFAIHFKREYNTNMSILKHSKSKLLLEVGGVSMEYYEVAAKWWADRIRRIDRNSFNGNTTSNIKDKCGALVKTIVALEYQPSEKTIHMFETSLARQIKEYVEKQGQMILEVSTIPDYFLGKVAKEMGLNALVFPQMVTMRINPERILVTIEDKIPPLVIFEKETA